MSVKSSMLYKLLSDLPNPTLIYIGGFQLKSVHIVIVVFSLLTYIAVKKICKLANPPDTNLNLVTTIAFIFAPIALIIIILLAGMG